AALQRARRVGEDLEDDVDQRGGGERPGVPDDVAALDGGALEALQVDRGALARHRALDGVAVGLEPTDLGDEPARKDLDAVVDAERARRQRSGDRKSTRLNS